MDDRERCRLIWNYAIDVWLDETNLDVPEGIAQLSYLISYFSMADGGASITYPYERLDLDRLERGADSARFLHMDELADLLADLHEHRDDEDYLGAPQRFAEFERLTGGGDLIKQAIRRESAAHPDLFRMDLAT